MQSSKKSVLKIHNLIFMPILLLFLLNPTALAQSKDDLYEISVKNFGVGNVPQNAVALPLAELKIKANEDLELSEILVKRSGLSSWEDFGNIWASTNNYARSTRGRVGINDMAQIKFRHPVKIPKGESENFTIFVNLNLQGTGRNFNFDIEKLVIDGVSETQTAKFSRSYKQKLRTASQYSVPTWKFDSLGNESSIKIGRTAEVG